MLSLLVAATAFSGPTCHAPRAVRGGAPSMSLDRRSAIGAAAAAAVAMPWAAVADSQGNQATDNSNSRFNNKNLGTADTSGLNDGTEDAMAKIARANAEKLAAEKRAFAESRRPKTEEELLAEQEKAKTLITGIAAGGTILSGAFIIPNLQRLAIKVTSGGKDAGYDKVPVKGKKVAKKQATGVGGSAGTAKKILSSVFARPID